MKIMALILFLILPVIVNAETQLIASRGEQEINDTHNSIYYFGYFSSSLPDIKSGDPSVFSYHLFAFNFWRDSKFSMSFRPAFTVETRGQKYGEYSPMEADFSDTQIAVIHKDPIGTEKESSSKLVYKVYLPTDPEWREKGVIGGLGLEFEISREFANGIAMGYLPRGYYLLGESKRTQDTQNKKGQFEHWITISKFFGQSHWLTQGLGHRNIFYENSVSIGLLETKMTFEVTSAIHLSFGVSQEHEQNKSEYELYNNSETSYFLMTSFQI